MSQPVENADEKLRGTGAAFTSRRYYRWSLKTLLLVLTLIAAWTAYGRLRSENRRLQSRILQMQEIARELAIRDYEQFAAVRVPETWMDDNRWHVYLPPGFNHRLQLATHAIDRENFPDPAVTFDVESGKHSIELQFQPDGENWAIQLSCDGKRLCRQTMPKDWYPNRGHSQVGISRNEVLPTNQPLLLMRRRFQENHGPGATSSEEQPCNGMLLWVVATPSQPTKLQPSAP